MADCPSFLDRPLPRNQDSLCWFDSMNASLFHKKRQVFEDLSGNTDWKLLYQIYQYFSCGKINDGITIRNLYDTFRADESMQAKLNIEQKFNTEYVLTKELTLTPYKKEVKFNYLSDGSTIEADNYAKDRETLFKNGITSLGNFTRTTYFKEYEKLKTNNSFEVKEEENLKQKQTKEKEEIIKANQDKNPIEEGEISRILQVNTAQYEPNKQTIKPQKRLSNFTTIDGTPYITFSIDIEEKNIYVRYYFALDTSPGDLIEVKEIPISGFSINSSTIQDVKDYSDQLTKPENEILKLSMFLENPLLYEKYTSLLDIFFEKNENNHPELLLVDIPLKKTSSERIPFTILETLTLSTGVYTLDAIVINIGAHYFSVLKEKEGWVVYNDTEIEEGQTLQDYITKKQTSTTTAEQDKASILLGTIKELEKSNVQTAGNATTILNGIITFLPDEAENINLARSVGGNTDKEILEVIKKSREQIIKTPQGNIYKPAIIPTFEDLIKTKVSNSQLYVNKNARFLVYSRKESNTTPISTAPAATNAAPSTKSQSLKYTGTGSFVQKGDTVEIMGKSNVNNKTGVVSEITSTHITVGETTIDFEQIQSITKVSSSPTTTGATGAASGTSSASATSTGTIAKSLKQNKFSEILAANGINNEKLQIGDHVYCKIRDIKEGKINNFRYSFGSNSKTIYVEVKTNDGSWSQPAHTCSKDKTIAEQYES